MRSTRTHRKALTALALGFATAAVFASTASAHVIGMFPAQSAEISYLSWGATADDLGPFAAQQAPSFSPITSVAELYAGKLEPSQPEISYLSWGATADDLGPFKQTVVDRTKLPDGGNYDYSSDNSVAQAARSGGITAANVGVAQPDGYQPQLQGSVQAATVSGSSDSFDRGDLVLGFGLGLILATAGAIALSMTRDRDRTRMAHS